jgi:hypothetical protein
MYGSVAAKVRREKDEHPERFCTNTQCLWRETTRDGRKPCPKHSKPVAGCRCTNNGDLCDACFVIDEAMRIG